MPTSHAPAQLTGWHLVVAGVLLPAAFAALDRLMLDRVAGMWRLDRYMPTTMAVFIVQIAVIGVIAARWFERPLLRCLVYGWCWVAVDFQMWQELQPRRRSS